jgi:hypothetical protein
MDPDLEAEVCLVAQGRALAAIVHDPGHVDLPMVIPHQEEVTVTDLPQPVNTAISWDHIGHHQQDLGRLVGTDPWCSHHRPCPGIIILVIIP